MQLTRRDATAALAAIGATGGIGFGIRQARQEDGTRQAEGTTDDERVRQTFVAVAEVVYPDDLSGTEAFVDGFLEGRLAQEDHAAGIREAVTELDELARSWYDGAIAELSVEERDRLLREVGADTADEDPDGTTAERVRYYLVNDLLLALYASPTGGELIGMENPQGHPGGTESYRQGPR